MKNRWIATLVLLALALTTLLSATAVAEPTVLSMTLGVGETYQIKTSAISGAEGKQLVFATSNKKVATVSAEGVITAKRKGSAKIAVGYDDTALAVCTVKVLGKPGSLKFAQSKMVLNVGESGQLTPKLPKKTASYAITYELAPSDNVVATVAEDGKVTGVAAGEAVITAKTYNNKTAKCAVKVLAGKAPTTLKVDVEALPLYVKESFKLTPSVEDGAEAVYAYSSSNKKIATVNAEGKIVAKKKGKAKITVKTHNGLTATVNVTVKAKLKDCFGLLTNKTKTFKTTVKKLKLKKDKDTTGDDKTSVMYYNSQLALIMTPNSCQATLAPAAKPKYSILGIDVNTPAEVAAAKLAYKGWKMSESKTVDGNEVRAFAKEGDTEHVITISANGSDIQSIDAFWIWKTE